MSQWNHKSEMLWVNSSIRLQIPVAGHRTSGREGSGLEVRPEGGLRGVLPKLPPYGPAEQAPYRHCAGGQGHPRAVHGQDALYLETLQRLPFKARNAVFKKLEEIVDIASMSKEERMRYDESIKVYRDQLAVMEFERNKGLAEGRAEEKENEARNLKRMGMDVETIAKATGLDSDVIESL